jgi:twitching motility protein PilT
MTVLKLAPLVRQATDVQASDIHIAVGAPVMLRVHGVLVSLEMPPVTAPEAKNFVESILTASQQALLEQRKAIDFALSIDDMRLRAHCHFEGGNLGVTLRLVPAVIPSLESIGLENIGKRLLRLRNGLVLFTGPTGMGKSTSLASLLQSLHETESVHTITLEDPVEFLIPARQGLIRQREFGKDFLSFPDALRDVLRQDPNVVMIGEMRDPETAAAALTLAETGHLIFATLHTADTVQAVNRIIDLFPASQQGQIRSQLSFSLKAIIAQRLVPAVEGGRVAVREVLFRTPAVANLIRENGLQELPTVLQTQEKQGQCSFERALQLLYKEGKISKETLGPVDADL